MIEGGYIIRHAAGDQIPVHHLFIYFRQVWTWDVSDGVRSSIALLQR